MSREPFTLDSLDRLLARILHAQAMVSATFSECGDGFRRPADSTQDNYMWGISHIIDEIEAIASTIPTPPEPNDDRAPMICQAASRERRVYLAGPMTGLPDLNFPAFHAAAAKLRGQGFHVENPAEHGVVDGAEWEDYLRYDLARLATCETICLLPGWRASKGARLEAYIAKALGMPIIPLPGFEYEQEPLVHTYADGYHAAGAWWKDFSERIEKTQPHAAPANLAPFAAVLPDHQIPTFLEGIGALLVAWKTSGEPTADYMPSRYEVAFNKLSPEAQEAQFDASGKALTEIARGMIGDYTKQKGADHE